MSEIKRFGIIGGGAWGTALAQTLRRAERDVVLWAREPEVVSAINAQHENKLFLSGIALDPAIQATDDFEAIKSCDAWMLVTPTQVLREVGQRLAAMNAPTNIPLVLCSKGVEQKTLALPSEIINAVLPRHPLAILSGPTFAAEVARGLPTAMTLACADQQTGRQLMQAIGTRAFRPYLSDDVIGAQIGGVIKNVIAIAAGIAVGCGMGDNARAALITRGLAEMSRLGVAMKAQAETLTGLSGLGDLVLTCSSTQSRNMSLGLALGKGTPLSEILTGRKSVAEGVHTAAAALALARKYGVEMPIVDAVDAVLNRGADVMQSIDALLTRPLKTERA